MRTIDGSKMSETRNVGDATLDVLRKYSQLLNDAPETRSVLAQDENLASFLLSTLTESQDQKVIRMALEIILELISCAGNKTKEVMCSNNGFKNIMVGLKEKFKYDANISFICGSVMDNLFPDHRMTVRPAPTTTTNNSNRARIPRFLAVSTRQQLKTLIFQSEAFGDTDVKRTVELVLVKVKGVVSIYFEPSSTSKKWRCIIRVGAAVMPQTIAESILTTGRLSSVQQVSKDEYGEEILISYGNDEQVEEKKVRLPDKSSPLPGYLDENDDLIFGVVIGDRALTKFGEKESNKSGGWLSGVSSFLSKTLYW